MWVMEHLGVGGAPLRLEQEMDDKTLQALTTLAEKLGTTAEYLWGVLIKQAPITGTVDLLLTVAWIVAVAFWFSFVKRKTTSPPISETNRFPQAEWDGEAAFFAWLSVGVFTLLAALLISSSLAGTIAAIFNPEYWALAQILK